MDILKEIESYCNEKITSGALLITGPWGSGKTHYIKKTVMKKAAWNANIHFLLISLFGLSSVEEIRNAVNDRYFTEYLGSNDPNKDLSFVNKARSFVNKINELNLGESVTKVLLAADPKNYVEVRNTIFDKEEQVVLIFDDLERSKIDDVELIGCLNEYCENRQIKTIIIANEDDLLGRNNDEGSSNKKNKESNDDNDDGKNKLSYKEIKEKLVSRTIAFRSNLQDMIDSLIDNLYVNEGNDKAVESTDTYISFLKEKSESISNICEVMKYENFRVLKCGLSDFKRVYDVSIAAEYEELTDLFFDFVVYYICSRDNKLSGVYDGLMDEDEIKKKYPGIYSDKGMPSCVVKWIKDYIWEADEFKAYINNKKNMNTPQSSLYKLRTYDILDCDDLDITSSYEEYRNMAHNGDLSLYEYVTFIENRSFLRSIKYELPVEADMDKVKNVVEEKIQEQILDLSEDSKRIPELGPAIIKILDEKEQIVYNMILQFARNCTDLNSYAKNKRSYINALDGGNITEINLYRNKKFNSFDKEIRSAIFNFYKDTSNDNRNTYISSFIGTWQSMHNVVDYFLYEDSIKELEELKSAIKNLKTDRVSLANIAHEKFIAVIEETINRYNDCIEIKNKVAEEQIK
ncbi:MAG: hypothetical protein IKM61_08530 [Eubacteriaceae bacterium]|nr:hypothetical protein [Eubacteriaceae bacterium]